MTLTMTTSWRGSLRLARATAAETTSPNGSRTSCARSSVSVILVDTGPLYALVDRADRHHLASLELLSDHPGPLVVPVLVVTETTYLIGGRLGADAEVRFLGDVAAGRFVIEQVDPDDWLRIAELVHRYRDLPLGTVDASVVLSPNGWTSQRSPRSTAGTSRPYAHVTWTRSICAWADPLRSAWTAPPYDAPRLQRPRAVRPRRVGHPAPGWRARRGRSPAATAARRRRTARGAHR